jgi:uncharacterized membrane protein
MISDKNRTEAFSDGIFSIAITLLILEIKVPPHRADLTNAELARALIALWPSYLALLASFATILVMWINHHGFFNLLQKIDGPFLYANGFLLLIVVLVPFPTALLAEHLTAPSANTAAVVYCGTFVLINIGYNLMYYTGTRSHLLRRDIHSDVLHRVKRAYQVGFVWYGLAAAVAWFHALTGTIICSLLWLLWTRLDYSPNFTNKLSTERIAS